MIFTKRQGRSSSNSGYEIQKIRGSETLYTRARAPLVRKYTDRIFESKDGTASMKIVNYIERHNFRWNYLLTKSNRTEIQTYEVEERTFGTPCTTNIHNPPWKSPEVWDFTAFPSSKFKISRFLPLGGWQVVLSTIPDSSLASQVLFLLKLYICDAVIHHFRCRWTVMYWKIVLWIEIEVHSVKRKLPKSLVVCMYIEDWRK